MKEIIAAWKDYLDEERIVEYINSGMLTCGVLLGDRLVKVIRPSLLPGHRGYTLIELNGYFTLAAEDAVSAYNRSGCRHSAGGCVVEHVTGGDQKIILKSPYYKVGWVSNWLARRRDLRITHKERERFARQCGIGKVEEHADAEHPVDEYAFRKKGSDWELIYQGKQELCPHDLKGFYLIAHLLRNPGKDVYAGDLLSAAGVEQSELMPAQRAHAAELAAERAAIGRKRFGIDVDDVADPKTRASLKERHDELLAEFAEAERDNDIGRKQRVQQEIEEFHKYAKSAYGRDGSSERERNRFRRRVSKLINTAMRQLQRDHPSLGSHLSDTIKKGTCCSYRPGTHLNWKL